MPRALLLEHTAETGQPFTPEALARVWDLTQGRAGRMDLCLRDRDLTLGMELKVWRDGAPDPLAEGLDQLDGYLAGLGLDSGWLVIFDRRAGQPPIAERTASHAATSPGGRAIQVVRA